MAVSNITGGASPAIGQFGSASLGSGLRVGLSALQNSERALEEIQEARRAAVEAAQERIARATDTAGLADEAVQSTDVNEQPETGAFARIARAQAEANASQPPAPTPDETGRGGLLDLTV